MRTELGAPVFPSNATTDVAFEGKGFPFCFVAKVRVVLHFVYTFIRVSRVFILLPQDVDGGWAGGRGFKKQPYLTLVDAGGGMVKTDSTTMVTASVTPSLMVS